MWSCLKNNPLKIVQQQGRLECALMEQGQEELPSDVELCCREKFCWFAIFYRAVRFQLLQKKKHNGLPVECSNDDEYKNPSSILKQHENVQTKNCALQMLF